MKTYHPVNCEFHDAIESYATLRQTVDMVVADAAGGERGLRAVVCDVFASQGEEFLRTDSGEQIRLDRLRAIGRYRRVDFEPPAH